MKTLYTNKNVLLVEDNKVNQMVARRSLESAGIHVALATNGQEAIELASTRKFDLILMDLEMPLMGGLDASKGIRMNQLSRAPIIAMTAHSSDEIKERCKQANMNGFVTKPVTADKLDKLLSRMLG